MAHPLSDHDIGSFTNIRSYKFHILNMVFDMKGVY